MKRIFQYTTKNYSIDKGQILEYIKTVFIHLFGSAIICLSFCDIRFLKMNTDKAALLSALSVYYSGTNGSYVSNSVGFRGRASIEISVEIN